MNFIIKSRRNVLEEEYFDKDFILLTVDLDKMWADVSITEPLTNPEEEERKKLTADDLIKYLNFKGITTGIINERVDEVIDFIDSGIYELDVRVAEAKAPVDGTDGHYEYLVPIADDKAKPKINEDGSVDYYNSLSLAMVNENQVFAEYYPATSGEFGYNVYGDMVKPKKGKNQSPLRGSGFTSEDENGIIKYRASMSGRIHFNDTKVIIDQVYIVKGDLDIMEGNINFSGDVEIKGDVRSGLTLEAKGNVYVHGHMGASKIIAGKNVVVKRGIQGKDKGRIEAGGDVTTSFVERCEIDAGGSVFAESVLDANIYARNTIDISAKAGTVVGGSLTAAQGIVMKQAGNETGAKTMLNLNVSPYFLRRVAELRNTTSRLKGEIEMLEARLEELNQLDDSQVGERVDNARMQCLRVKVIKTTEYKQAKEELDFREEEMENSKRKAAIIVNKLVYPGTVINIWREPYAVKNELRSVRYVLKGGRVREEGID